MRTKHEEPFIEHDELLTLETAIERAEHEANSGGHSAIIMRGLRQVRFTFMRPDPHVNYTGPAVRWNVVDERTDDGPWQPFMGWTNHDRSIHEWKRVSHTYTDKRGGCASKLCAQYGHAGGPKAIR